MAEMNPKTARPTGDDATKAPPLEPESLDAIRAEVMALADLVRSYVLDQAQQQRSRAEAAADEIAEKTRQARADLSKGIEEAEKALDTTVRENPLQSLLIAFGLGVIVSFLMRR